MPTDLAAAVVNVVVTPTRIPGAMAMAGAVAGRRAVGGHDTSGGGRGGCPTH